MNTINFYYDPKIKGFKFHGDSTMVILRRPRGFTKALIIDYLKHEGWSSYEELINATGIRWESVNHHIEELVKMKVIKTEITKIEKISVRTDSLKMVSLA